MREECFSTQEEILSYLGKKNDRNLIQRMIRNGKIYKEDGMYHLFVEEDSINSLKDRIRLLEEENRKLREKSEGFNMEELANYKKWLNEANVAYEELEANSENQLDESLERCFNQMNRAKSLPVLQAPTFKEFKKWALGMDTSDTDADFVDLPF